MTVRGRVAAAMIAVALPAVVLVAAISVRARARAALDATAAAVVERMESGGRERCEADPTRFGGAQRGRPRRGHGPRGALFDARLFAYDAALKPASTSAPRLDAGVRDALADDGVAILSRGAGRRGGVAVRMPWTDGPCAVVLARVRGGPRLARADSMGRELGVALAVLAVALVVALVALGPPLGRLRRLSREVRDNAEHGYERPTTIDGQDEIGEVARAFDDAARRLRDQVTRLEARDRALTEYVDATTHDLAIPLTVLQGRLGDAERQLRESGQVDHALLEGAVAECQYLEQLVGNMAAAARLDAGEPHVERAPLDLGAMVERVAARFQAAARHRHLSLEYAVPDAPVTIRGDEILLERAVSNLVHNAIRHHDRREGGRVAVVLDRDTSEGGEGLFRLTVRDDGGGLDDAALERLIRGADDPTVHRSRGRGLGLRITRAVALAHGLTLTFARDPEGGLEVSLAG